MGGSSERHAKLMRIVGGEHPTMGREGRAGPFRESLIPQACLPERHPPDFRIAPAVSHSCRRSSWYLNTR